MLSILLWPFSIGSSWTVLWLLSILIGSFTYRHLQAKFDDHLLKTQKLHRIPALDEFFIFERVGCPNTCGGIIETTKIDNFNTFKKWAREVFAEKLPMGKCKIKQVFGVFYH